MWNGSYELFSEISLCRVLASDPSRGDLEGLPVPLRWLWREAPFARDRWPAQSPWGRCDAQGEEESARLHQPLSQANALSVPFLRSHPAGLQSKRPHPAGTRHRDSKEGKRAGQGQKTTTVLKHGSSTHVPTAPPSPCTIGGPPALRAGVLAIVLEADARTETLAGALSRVLRASESIVLWSA